MRKFSVLIVVITAQSLTVFGQHSVARQWNEVMLEAIRNDFARPTVHARNLFHVSMAMYDAWAAFDETSASYILNKTRGNVHTPFNGINTTKETIASQEEAISYAAYRLLSHRFAQSPGAWESQQRFDALMVSLGYDIDFTSTDYSNGSPAALGNYIARSIIDFGLVDGANESGDYENTFYEPVNPPLLPAFPGNPDIADPNRWQPLTLEYFVDQSGHIITNNSPPFLGPEWGSVVPFSLKNSNLKHYERDGHIYKVYHDPGPPPYLDTEHGGEMSNLYKWNFSLVAAWSSHLDPSDGVMWDISPASIGNIQEFPESFAAYPEFYELKNGGDPSIGHPVNPVTGKSYEPQLVPRGDYTRVLAEFWADGPDSETPPGHWFTILNYVSDHADLEKKFNGEGPELSDLEWDIKSYFILGGAMHDVAVSAWSIKGWYDYIRPVSAIRFLADQGQSTDAELPNYNKNGIPLIAGYIELVSAGDPLAGSADQHLNKIKIKAWRGPDYITDTSVDNAGVDWILAENWWPYQRPSFVTPPFAGYISGHSTYSRAAAEILTQLTGTPYFPGGMGEFVAKKNEFLVFENGPSVDIKLQWATYQDASDQCSLSRIWGGIHPPADDIKGRIIGKEIGKAAFRLAEKYFDGTIVTGIPADNNDGILAYPNPVKGNQLLTIKVPSVTKSVDLSIYDLSGNLLLRESAKTPKNGLLDLDLSQLKQGIYIIYLDSSQGKKSIKLKVE